MSIRNTTTAVLLCGLTGAAAAQQTTECVQPGAAITDGVPLVVPVTINAPAGAMIDDVRIDLDLTHPWIGDLVVTVEHA
ncbi:MAG: hypothetical protein AAGK04_14615, partial [Planctomycetota bacterium]